MSKCKPAKGGGDSHVTATKHISEALVLCVTFALAIDGVVQVIYCSGEIFTYQFAFVVHRNRNERVADRACFLLFLYAQD